MVLARIYLRAKTSGRLGLATASALANDRQARSGEHQVSQEDSDSDSRRFWATGHSSVTYQFHCLVRVGRTQERHERIRHLIIIMHPSDQNGTSCSGLPETHAVAQIDKGTASSLACNRRAEMQRCKEDAEE